MIARADRFPSGGGFSFSPTRITAGSQRGHVQLILDLDSLTEKSPRKSPVELAIAAARGGVDSIQVRGKKLGAGALLDQTVAVVAALRKEGVTLPVLVNERLDVALLAAADGVHLPERSLNPVWAGSCRQLAAAALKSTSFVVGRSVHDAGAAGAAGTEQLDYVLFGHIFATDSKPGIPPRGVDALAHVVGVCPIPVLAVGGITAENAGRVIEKGASGIAVIGAICDAPDPYEAARALRSAVDAAWAHRERPQRSDPGEKEGRSMRVTVNGRPYDVEPGTTLLEFLQSRAIDVRTVAVARNEEIVPRKELERVRLDHGDVLEIIKVVAGG